MGLVPRPGVEPEPAALGARSLSHWTTREVPIVKNKGEMGIELPGQCLERWMLSRSELQRGLFSPVFRSSASALLVCWFQVPSPTCALAMLHISGGPCENLTKNTGGGEEVGLPGRRTTLSISFHFHSK